MKNAVEPSFSIDSVIANLSETTEIDCSDGSQFSEMLQKYQNDAHTIQSILNTLYHQIDKSLSPTSTNGQNSKSVTVPCEVIQNLQERLKVLEKENEDLSIQMQHFAEMSQYSSIKLPHSKIMSEHLSQSSRQTLSAFPDISSINSPFTQNIQSPKELVNSPNHSNSLVVENQRLRQELIKQKEINFQLQQQQTTILRNLLSITNQPNDSHEDDFAKIESNLQYLSNYVIATKSQKHIFHHISSEMLEEKQKIVKILNSFKDEMLNVRLIALNQLHSRKNTSSCIQNASIHSGIKSIDPISLSSITQSHSSMIERGCQELIDAISSNFSGIEQIPFQTISNDPQVFGQYINRVRAHLNSNIEEIKQQNRQLKSELLDLNQKLNDSTVSPTIAKTISKVMSEINKVTQEMQKEHKELLDQLQ